MSVSHDGIAVHCESSRLLRLEWKASALDGQSLIQGGGVEVHRGPLLFALRPESTDVGDLIHKQDGFPPIRHHTITIAENASWNYVRKHVSKYCCSNFVHLSLNDVLTVA